MRLVAPNLVLDSRPLTAGGLCRSPQEQQAFLSSEHIQDWSKLSEWVTETWLASLSLSQVMVCTFISFLTVLQLMEVFSYPSSSEPYASVTLGFFMLKFVFTSHSCHSYSTESALPTLKLDGLWESIEVVWWDRTRFSGLPRLKEFSFILNVLPALTTLYFAFPSYLIYKIPLYPLSSWCKTLFRQGNTVVIWTGSRRSFAQPLTRPLHLSSIMVALCVYI